MYIYLVWKYYYMGRLFNLWFVHKIIRGYSK